MLIRIEGEDLWKAGVVGGEVAAALLSVVAGLGVIGEMVANLTIVVERTE